MGYRSLKYHCERPCNQPTSIKIIPSKAPDQFFLTGIRYGKSICMDMSYYILVAIHFIRYHTISVHAHTYIYSYNRQWHPFSHTYIYMYSYIMWYNTNISICHLFLIDAFIIPTSILDSHRSQLAVSCINQVIGAALLGAVVPCDKADLEMGTYVDKRIDHPFGNDLLLQLGVLYCFTHIMMFPIPGKPGFCMEKIR